MDDAKDICQTVLIKLVEEGRRFPDLGQERAWVVRLSVNACKNWKKSAWFRRRAAGGGPAPGGGGAGAGGRRAAGPGERPAPKYRQVVYLRYYEEYEVHEIAALLGQSPPW